MDEENIITSPDSPEAAAAEDAAFAASFAESRGEEAPQPETPEVTEQPAESQGNEGAPANEGAPPETEAPKLFAGLTEEQVAAALARTGSMQTTVDKMAGRIGQLMQQIEALRTNPPTTQQAQKALDLKLEKLSGAFPELANLLREDLQVLSGAPAAELPAAAPAGITQEQFDAALAERLKATQEQLNEKLEVKVLTILHPDWNQLIKTNEFALWRDNVLGAERGRALMTSEDSAFISQHLTEFKAWRAATANPNPNPVPTPKPVARTTRLSNAVLPTGGAAPAQAPVTEEDAFAAGFKRERARAAG